VTAGAIGALFGDVEEVGPLLPGGDFIGGHLLDEVGLLWPCGDGKQSEGEGDTCTPGTQMVPTLRWDREVGRHQSAFIGVPSGRNASSRCRPAFATVDS
jgi:hypothetical protein